VTTIDAPQPPIARLRYDLDLRVVDSGTAFLASERGMATLTGELAVAVASRLDGTRTPDEIVSELIEDYAAERVRHVLDRLVASGYAVIESGQHDRGVADDASLYEMGGVESAIAGHRLATATVAVHEIGDVNCADVVEQLQASGVGTIVRPIDPAEEVAGVTLSVVLTDDYLRCELDLINRIALTTATPWMLARPVGSVVWVGPFFRPNVTGCWSCLAHRITANRQSHTFLQRRLGEAQPIGMSSVRHRVGSAIGVGLVSLEVLKSITGIPAAEPSVVTIDLLTGGSDRHHFTRRPQCPVCGDGTMVAARALEPVRFSPRSKAPTSDGGHRATEPEAMVERFSRQVSAITGVVTSLQRIAIPGSLYVFTAGQNISRQPADLQALRRGLRALSCGKGTSEIQARASAIGEAIERFSAVFQGDELRRRATFAKLGDAAIHPNASMLFSDRQYEQRELWNLGAPGFRTVFEPFVEEETIDWSPVWSVTNQRTRWLPTQYLYYGYPLEGGRLFTYADSNGCASGTSLEDAALQGFCELVERDSVALWWYNRVRRPGIDLDSFHDAYIDRLREAYAGFGREVWALDLTADLGIPAVGAFSRITDADREDILIAFGAHLDARVAVVRALTEMNQFLPAVLPAGANGARLAPYPDAAFATWCQTATLANQPYLVPEPRAAPRVATSWPTQATDDLAADLEHCQGLIEARGLELLLLEQTRPDIGLPVAKVIVPGLRHFWPRFAPGRLFDVPVALGWCPHKTEEHKLNPVPIFI
jgi:bacteriocin biosynthesis cyclodehydratase domain-containing protein